MPNYSSIDRPATLSYVFYPRKDVTPCPGHAFDLPISVEDNVSILCRFYLQHSGRPWILFFHGNGEVVSDYDEMAPLYHQHNLNLIVTDYRGYGASEGVPTLRDLAHDAHVLFQETKGELSKRGYRDDLWVMGRSLGSISALELACHHQDALPGLIIESGFVSVVRIIRHLGIPVDGEDLDRIDQECVEMAKQIKIPSLIIHGEDDILVPFREAQELYQHLGAEQKQLLSIPNAGHNDLLFVGFQAYFQALEQFIQTTDSRKSG